MTLSCNESASHKTSTLVWSVFYRFELQAEAITRELPIACDMQERKLSTFFSFRMSNYLCSRRGISASGESRLLSLLLRSRGSCSSWCLRAINVIEIAHGAHVFLLSISAAVEFKLDIGITRMSLLKRLRLLTRWKKLQLGYEKMRNRWDSWIAGRS